MHTEFFPSEGFFADGRQERISAPFPEIHHEGESNTSKLEILPKPEEIRSKSPKIRSLRGSETESVNMETAFHPELRYPERRSFQPSSEIRLKMNESPLSTRPALRDDPGPLPWFSQRVDTPVRVGDLREEDYGRMYHQTTSGGDHYAGYPTQDQIFSLPPRPATVFASEVGQSVRFGRDDRQNVTQRDTKRPKERTRDQAYRKRFSLGVSPDSRTIWGNLSTDRRTTVAAGKGILFFFTDSIRFGVTGESWAIIEWSRPSVWESLKRSWGLRDHPYS